MKIIQWIGGLLSTLFGTGLGPDMIKGLNQAYKDKLNARTELEQIVADKQIAFFEGRVSLLTSANAQGTDRQKFKFNFWVFWLILGLAFVPGMSTWLLLMFYNVFWHANGMWPQPWNIAAFPPPYDRFVDMSMEWLFDPIKMGQSLGAAGLGGLITGKRK